MIQMNEVFYFNQNVSSGIVCFCTKKTLNKLQVTLLISDSDISKYLICKIISKIDSVFYIFALFWLISSKYCYFKVRIMVLWTLKYRGPTVWKLGTSEIDLTETLKLICLLLSWKHQKNRSSLVLPNFVLYVCVVCSKRQRFYNLKWSWIMALLSLFSSVVITSSKSYEQDLKGKSQK